MKNFIIILLLLQTFLLYSQNDRFIYQVDYKKDSTTNKITKENYNLDITQNGINYYNRLYYINDSVYTHFNQYGFEGFKLTSFFSKKAKDPFYESYEYIGDVNFYKIETLEAFNWKITDSTKTINELKVQKAETNFGGRKWCVWFAPEIPLSYGPYKFNGLPGLIIQLHDTQNNYIFKLIKSEKISNEYESYTLKGLKSRAIKTNYIKLNNLKLELYQDPFKYIFNGKLNLSEGKKLQLEDGTILTKEELKPAEKKERMKLKSYNNPIERDKTTIYPK